MLEGRGAEADRRPGAAHGGRRHSTLRIREAARLRDQIDGLKRDPVDASRSRATASEDIDAVALVSRARRILRRRSCSCAAAAISAARNSSRAPALAESAKCSRAFWRSTTSDAKRRPRSSSTADRRRGAARARCRSDRAHGAHPHRRRGDAGALARRWRAPTPRSGCACARDRGNDSPSSSRRVGEVLGLSAAAAAHRVFRREPHDGRGDGGVVRRVRPAGADEGGLSSLQHRRRRARRRLRRDPPGARRGAIARIKEARRRCRTCC